MKPASQKTKKKQKKGNGWQITSGNAQRLGSAQGDLMMGGWVKDLFDEPLSQIVQAINSRDNPQRDANSFERLAPHRLDYRLYRKYIISSQYYNVTQRAHLTADKCAELIIESLNSKNPLVAAGSRLVLVKLKLEHLKDLASAGTDALAKISVALDKSKPINKKTMGSDAALCDAICIPHVKLMLREVKEKLDNSNPKLPSDVTWLQPVILEVVDALRRILNRSDLQDLGKPIPIHKDRLYRATKGTPWNHKETILLISKTLVEVGNYVSSIRIDGVTTVGLEQFLHLLDQSVLLVQCGWLSLRGLSETLQTKDEVVEEMQIYALAHLAELQHLRGNNILAGQYAVFALHANRAINDFQTKYHRSRKDNENEAIPKGALTTPECTTMRTLANRMGLYAPGRLFDGSKGSASIILARILELQHEFVDFFSVLQQLRRRWDGYDEFSLITVINRGGGDHDLICTVLKIAIRTGNLRLFLYILTPNKKINVDRQSILAAVKPEIVLLYADALATVQQQAVSLCYEGPSSRRILRILSKQNPPDQFNFMETLFIHHVQVGFSYYGLATHYAGRQATWALYESTTTEIRNQLFLDFAGMVAKRDFQPMSLEVFQKGRVSIDSDEVLVSLCTREGHEATLIVCGPNGASSVDVIDSVSARIYGNGNPAYQQNLNWHKIIDEFSSMARIRIQTRGPVLPKPEIIGLAKKMLDAIYAANPNVERVAFHSDAMFRVIPWQFIFQHCTQVRDHPIAQGGREFIVFHIEGVKFQSTKQSGLKTVRNSSRDVGWDIRNVAQDDFAREIEDALNEQKNGLRDKRLPGTRLSIIGHGKKRGVASRIEADGRMLSAEKMNEQMSDYELVALHACYGGYAINNELADIGGLPGFLLSHGCNILFASPLPLKKEEVLTLERQLSSLDNFEAEAVMTAYMAATREDSACAFYNLYLPQSSPSVEAAENPFPVPSQE